MLNKNKFANWPFHPKKWPFFYGWVIVACGSMGILMSIPGQTMGVSTFTDYLIDAIGITRDEITTAYLAGTITSAMLLTWVGKLYDKYGVRPIALLSTTGMALVLVYLSQSDRVIALFIEGAPGWTGVFFMFLGFFALRFSGQGALTMVSRNMMMKWFEKRRGMALGFSNVVTALGFSSAPIVFEWLIQSNGWRGAWLVMAVVAGVGFSIFVLIFFRDDPEYSDLQMDGGLEIPERQKKNYFPVVKEFTLAEARKVFAFWIFTGMLCMQAMYITGFTFNLTSIFDHAGLDRETAVSIFLPSSVIAVLITLSVSSLSDFIRLKFLLYIKGVGAIISLIGMIYLNEFWWSIYALIFGNAVLMGLYSVVLSVTWPRFFGKTNLGAIGGYSITFIVIASAIGPKLFSWSLTSFGSYDLAGWISLVLFAFFTLMAFWANNPQEKLRS